jgi:hypothetical protein
MGSLEISYLLLSRVFVLLFFAILFLQSALDKIIYARETKLYFQSVVQNSFLAPYVNLIYLLVTFFEFLAGSLCGIAIFFLFANQMQVAFLAMLFCGISLLTLFFGQRVVKDYAGAASLAAYFAVLILACLLFM